MSAAEIITGDGASLAIYRDAPSLDGARTAALGQFECESAEAGARLMRVVIERLKGEGFGAVLGPMDGSTWGKHRLLVESDGRSPFLMEPSNPAHYVDAFEASGLGIVSPARLTAPTVAAGAVARKWLKQQHGCEFIGWMSQLGPIAIEHEDEAQIPLNPFFAPNTSQLPQLEAYMDELRRAGDSCGARIEVRARNVPVGLGEPLYDKLDADIAFAMMGLNAVKGVEVGDGFACVAQRGSEHGDEMTPGGFASNHAGGVLGGISTGQELRVSLAIKPTSSIRIARASVNRSGEPTEVQTFGRHDPCVGIRATPIAEALLALVVMDHALLQRAQCADVQLPWPPLPAR